MADDQASDTSRDETLSVGGTATCHILGQFALFTLFTALP
jgi:hypothetical protein